MLASVSHCWLLLAIVCYCLPWFAIVSHCKPWLQLIAQPGDLCHLYFTTQITEKYNTAMCYGSSGGNVVPGPCELGGSCGPDGFVVLKDLEVLTALITLVAILLFGYRIYWDYLSPNKELNLLSSLLKWTLILLRTSWSQRKKKYFHFFEIGDICEEVGEVTAVSTN